MTESSPLYNIIGINYNSTRKADAYIAERLLNLLTVNKDGLYLDIGCGTGNYTEVLSKKGLSFVGVDPSELMLSVANQKSPSVQWQIGTAENIPAPDNSFSGAIATLTIHHWIDLEQAFTELHRVLKQGSRLVVFTSTPEQMQGYWLNHYFPKMMRESIIKMPALSRIEEASVKAGFTMTSTEKYFVQPTLTDHFLYAGKHNPQLYLQESIRNGISSFASLSNIKEVQQGLQQLQTDINENCFAGIKETYENNLGDYLFICFEKT